MSTRNAFLLLLLSLSWLSAARAGEAITQETAAQKVEIRNVQLQGNVVSGQVTNKSRYALRNLELLIQYHWLWNNEFKPGDVSPGKAFYLTLDQELRPGESASFTARLEPPPQAPAGGYFMTEVTLAGFTEIIPATAG